MQDFFTFTTSHLEETKIDEEDDLPLQDLI